MVKLEGLSSAGVAGICVFVCAGNALTLLAIGRTRSLQHKCNLLVAHLAIVDLVTGLVTWPVLRYLAEDGSSLVSCLGGHAVVIALKDVSQFLLLFVCIVMYIKIAYPLHYRRWLSIKQMQAVSAGTWLLGATIGGMSFVWTKDGRADVIVDTCFITVMPFPYWVGLINWPFVAVSVSILVMYVRIIRIARRHLHHHGSRKTRLLAAAAATKRFTDAAAAATEEARRGSRPSVVTVIPSITVVGQSSEAEPHSVRSGYLAPLSEGNDEQEKSVDLENCGKIGVTIQVESDKNRNLNEEFNRNDQQFLTLNQQNGECFELNAAATTENNENSRTPVPIENGKIVSEDRNHENLHENDVTLAVQDGQVVSSVDKVKSDKETVDDVKEVDAAAAAKKLTKLSLGLRPAPAAADARISPSPDGDGGTIFSFPVSSSSSISSITCASPPVLAVEPDMVTSSRCSAGSFGLLTGVRGAGAGGGGGGRRHHNHELQLVVTMLVTYLAFVMCWLPLEIAVYCTSLGIITDASQSAFVEFSLALSLANSGINVIIYSWRYMTFRKAIRNILTCGRYSNGSAASSAAAAAAASAARRLQMRQASSCHMYN